MIRCFCFSQNSEIVCQRVTKAWILRSQINHSLPLPLTVPTPSPTIHHPCKNHLYSSLCPYAITMSVNSFITVSAHLFISCNALRSFGFSKPCSSENLKDKINISWSSFNRFNNLVDHLIMNEVLYQIPNTCSVPVKIPSIDSNDNPAVQEALIVLFKLSYVLILAFGHFSPSISQPSLEKILLPRNTRHFLLSNQAIPTRLGASLQNG